MIVSREETRCKDCVNKSFPFDILNESELINLENNCTEVKYSKNEVIFKQDSPVKQVLYLKEGFVKLVHSVYTHDFIISLSRSKSYIGLSSVFSAKTYGYSAITLENSKVCFIDRDSFTSLINNNGEFAKRIIVINSKNELETFQRVSALIRKQVPGRLADMLLFFCNNVYQCDTFEIPLSRQEMADYLGVSKKSFIRTLSEFKNDRLINSNGREIEILEKNLVERLSKFG